MHDQTEFPIGCVVMAAGNARRFGENKLSAQIGGKTLLEHALEAVPRDRLSAVAVVTQYPEAADMASAFGFSPIRNDHPERGISHTIRLGTQALSSCGAILYQVADQPLLRRESVAALLDFYRRHPDHIVAMSHGGVRGNPCLFPAEYFPELQDLTGDTGGSAVIRRHPDRLLLFEVPEQELADVDTPAALEQLNHILEK